MVPKQPNLALCFALFNCVLALVIHVLGASTAWSFQLFICFRYYARRMGLRRGITRAKKLRLIFHRLHL